MSKYNKKGEEVVDMQLDSEEERAGQKVIFVIDQEGKEVLKEMLKQLKKINEKLEALE